MRLWYIATAALLGVTAVQALAQAPGDLIPGGVLPFANVASSVSGESQSGIVPTDLGGAGSRNEMQAARDPLASAQSDQRVRKRSVDPNEAGTPNEVALHVPRRTLASRTTL